ncbi:unnamed protein product [Owenia fusiformis]|uniref:Uncharacterized protein n=1 Tax=Owenia fusiformis TaxID=6347 RepID=A0A8S4PR64_OWEFU|nr:unnamed protein product [Owenia fusiformis]
MSAFVRRPRVRTRSQSRADSLGHTPVKNANQNCSNGELHVPGLSGDETPQRGNHESTPLREGTPFRAQQKLVFDLKSRLEQLHIGSAEPTERTSPGLARLRMTPGGKMKLRETQQILTEKHQEAKNQADKLNIGGGVSLWPGMENMRLTKRETAQLIVACVFMLTAVLALFQFLHGTTLKNLQYYCVELDEFPLRHPIQLHNGQDVFVSTVLNWHAGFTNLMDEIHGAFDIQWVKSPWSYKLCGVGYIMGVAVLLYYLLDNVLAQSKLTPRRIKIWVSLLVVIGTWTVLLAHLLLNAQRLEHKVEKTVHKLNRQLAELVYTDLDLTRYKYVLLYWQTLCLPPTTHGTLNIFGIVTLRDVLYYLQYYSVPIVTALLTPVVNLIVSLRDIYTVKVHTE